MTLKLTGTILTLRKALVAVVGVDGEKNLQIALKTQQAIRPHMALFMSKDTAEQAITALLETLEWGGK